MAQNRQDWDALGHNIQDAVDRAVNSRDFQKLNQTVRQVVEGAVELGTGAVRVGSEAVRTVVDGVSTHRATRELYGPTLGRSVKGFFKAACGFPLSVSGFFGLFFGRIDGMPVWQNPASAFAMALVLLGGSWLAFSGVSTLKMLRRHKQYRRTLGQKTYCSLEKLARAVGKDEKFVRKDVQKMIDRGLFREGHLDKEKTCLITSNETYRYFEQSRLQLEQRQRQQAALQAEKAASGHAPQVREVLDKGNDFLTQIRKCNEDIPGQEISEKISRIELIVQRIFERADAHPEIVPDLKKLMDYYLPMTVKLLRAYAEMDAQPVQGETILASKREIEQTLDTLNLAFEKLLDSMFDDTAMDVSTDITVLQTLLAQEGLTEDGFPKKTTTGTGE